jgi:hypothetical protein
MADPRRNSGPLRWAGLLAIGGALQRLLLWAAYQPVSYGDTPSYYCLARVLAEWNWPGYDGTRVPGYPAFLALTGLDEQRAWLAQMLLGWMLSLLLFSLVWRATRSAPLAVLGAAAYNLIPGLLLFEANLLSETLTAFLIVAAAWLYQSLELAATTTARLRLAAILGVIASLAGMVRPLFFFLPVWLAPFVLLGRGRWTQRAMVGMAFAAGPLLILGGWLVVMHSQWGVLSPTAMGGYNLIQHTGWYFEYLPDEHAAIRDTYLRYRDEQLAARGSQTNAIWEAIPEISRVSGLGFYDLSKELQRLSIGLIREHPDLYLRRAVKGWIDFWKAPIYWRPELFRPDWIGPGLQPLALLGRAISLLANLAFLGFSLIFVLLPAARSLFAGQRWLLAVAGMVWMTSLLQALADHGDNPRFLVPLQSLVILVVLIAVRSWWTARLAGRAADVG